MGKPMKDAKVSGRLRIRQPEALVLKEINTGYCRSYAVVEFCGHELKMRIGDKVELDLSLDVLPPAESPVGESYTVTITGKG